ncbi:MAG: trigger factor [Candidatus Gracilibacteria bacterium]|jgi:trigger factor
MKIEITKLPRSQAKIHVELDKEKFEEYKKKAAEEVGKHVEVPGFRKGFAPADMVIKQVGEHAIVHEAMEHAIQETYAKAVVDEKLDVVTPPKVNVVTEDPLVYDAEVALMPEVKVKEYKTIKVPKEEAKTEDKEVDEVIDDLRKKRSTHKDVERPVKKGDRVEIDFEGFDETGVPLEGTTSKNHPVILGDGTLLQDFDKELEGLKLNDKKEFEVSFPKDYHHKPFANKKVKFKVEVKKTQETLMPDLDEEFVHHVVGEKMSVDELKKRIKENLQTQKDHEAKAKREDKLLEKVLENTETEIPAMLLEEEVEYMMHQLRTDIESHGLKMEDYLKHMKKTEEEIKKEFEKEAEKRIKIRFALQFLFKAENVKIEDKEVEVEVAKIIASYPEKEQDKVKEEYKSREHFVQLKNRMALQKLFDALLKE